MKRPTLYETPYRHPMSRNKIVISQGIGGNGPWMAFTQNVYGSINRIKSKQLPERETPEAARADLDAWMKEKK